MNIKQVWYSPKADLQSPDTIHQVLMFGNLADIANLKRTIGKDKIKELFLQHPKKIYTNSALNFVKKMILDINTPIDEQNYLKSTARSIR